MAALVCFRCRAPAAARLVHPCGVDNISMPIAPKPPMPASMPPPLGSGFSATTASVVISRRRPTLHPAAIPTLDWPCSLCTAVTVLKRERYEGG